MHAVCFIIRNECAFGAAVAAAPKAHSTFLGLTENPMSLKRQKTGSLEAVLDVYVVINVECASGAAACAAIFAGVQPSRLTLRGLPLSGGVAPGYSQYSLPGWIVLLAVNLDTLKCRRRRIVDLRKR